MAIRLGVMAKDNLTGFTGVVVACIEYLNGCVQYELQPMSLDKDGKPAEAKWFDIQRLGVPTKETAKRPGGPEHSSLPTFAKPSA